MCKGKHFVVLFFNQKSHVYEQNKAFIVKRMVVWGKLNFSQLVTLLSEPHPQPFSKGEGCREDQKKDYCEKE
jgi:hypothetical protein